MTISESANAQRETLRRSAQHNQKWLIEGEIPLAKAGLLVGLHGGYDLAAMALDMALEVASPNDGHSGHARTKAAQGVCAHGSAFLLCAHDGKHDLRRRLPEVDPTGERQKACAGRLHHRHDVQALGSEWAGLFKMNRDGTVGTTPHGDDVWRQVVAVPDLKLVLFDPIVLFSQVNCEVPHVDAVVTEWFRALAKETGAAVVVTRWDEARPHARRATLGDMELRLLQSGGGLCH